MEENHRSMFFAYAGESPFAQLWPGVLRALTSSGWQQGAAVPPRTRIAGFQRRDLLPSTAQLRKF
jgi:hypothetical protein